MDRFRRIVQKFASQPRKITVADVVRLLEMLGYTERKNPGNHRVFHKKGSSVVTVPTVSGRSLKKQYIRQLVKRLELEEYLENS